MYIINLLIFLFRIFPSIFLSLTRSSRHHITPNEYFITDNRYTIFAHTTTHIQARILATASSQTHKQVRGIQTAAPSPPSTPRFNSTGKCSAKGFVRLLESSSSYDEFFLLPLLLPFPRLFPLLSILPPSEIAVIVFYTMPCLLLWPCLD